MSERDWLRDVPRPELNLIGFALRMLGSHSGSGDARDASLLADRFWDESVRRGHEEDLTAGLPLFVRGAIQDRLTSLGLTWDDVLRIESVSPDRVSVGLKPQTTTVEINLTAVPLDRLARAEAEAGVGKLAVWTTEGKGILKSVSVDWPGAGASELDDPWVEVALLHQSAGTWRDRLSQIRRA